MHRSATRVPQDTAARVTRIPRPEFLLSDPSTAPLISLSLSLCSTRFASVRATNSTSVRTGFQTRPCRKSTTSGACSSQRSIYPALRIDKRKVDLRNRRAIDAGQSHCPTLAEHAQRVQRQTARRGKDDSAIDRVWRAVVCPANPLCAEVLGSERCSGPRVKHRPRSSSTVRFESRYAHSIKANGKSFAMLKAAYPQCAKPYHAAAEQRRGLFVENRSGIG